MKREHFRELYGSLGKMRAAALKGDPGELDQIHAEFEPLRKKVFGPGYRTIRDHPSSWSDSARNSYMCSIGSMYPRKECLQEGDRLYHKLGEFVPKTRLIEKLSAYYQFDPELDRLMANGATESMIADAFREITHPKETNIEHLTLRATHDPEKRIEDYCMVMDYLTDPERPGESTLGRVYGMEGCKAGDRLRAFLEDRLGFKDSLRYRDEKTVDDIAKSHAMAEADSLRAMRSAVKKEIYEKVMDMLTRGNNDEQARL